jgi:hypothetical protein
MSKSIRMFTTLVVLCAFLFAITPMVASAQESKIGKLRGFVYGEDGKKPLSDAVVLLRETTSERIFQSVKTKKNGAYLIENILPGTYAVGIQWDGKDFNVDALVKIEPKKQMACFTLPKLVANAGYQVRCKSPKCFFILPVGWALVAAATAGITYGIVKIVEKETSPTGI